MLLSWKCVALAVLPLAALFAVLPDRAIGQPPSQEVLDAFADYQRTVQAIRCEVTAEIRICKGSYTDYAKSRYRLTDVGDVPPEDMTIETEHIHIRDFEHNRFYSKGYQHNVTVDLDENNTPVISLYREWSEGAFDGAEVASKTPREGIDNRSIPEGIQFPVEVWKMKVDDAGASMTTEPAIFPLHFWAGGVTAGRFTGDAMRGNEDLRSWKAQLVRQDDTEVVRLTSPPKKSGSYCELDIAPGYGYRVSRYAGYDGADLRLLLDIQYRPSGSDVTLAGWKLFAYREDGRLARQETYTVRELVTNPVLDADTFTIKADHGMVVAAEDGRNRTYYVEGEELQADTNRALNYLIAQQSTSWYWIAITGSIVFGIVCLVVLRRFFASQR